MNRGILNRSQYPFSSFCDVVYIIPIARVIYITRVLLIMCVIVFILEEDAHCCPLYSIQGILHPIHPVFVHFCCLFNIIPHTLPHLQLARVALCYLYQPCTNQLTYPSFDPGFISQHHRSGCGIHHETIKKHLPGARLPIDVSWCSIESGPIIRTRSGRCQCGNYKKCEIHIGCTQSRMGAAEGWFRYQV
ncbi:hypothetical protein BKA93DRAFT_124741 [Sparassis latifolia]